VELDNIGRHFSALQYGNNYCRKSFIVQAPRVNVAKLFYRGNLLPFSVIQHHFYGNYCEIVAHHCSIVS